MKKNIFTILVLSIAILISAITRFYKLGEAPHGFYLDEAGQGYSAYSILKTGKDEFGKSFPVVFRSFTDFKTPVYIYLIVPLIPLFGLTTFAVRFPSFIFSILTIPVLYFLILKIAPKKIAYALSSISVLLLAISPWHILFGRTNFECNVALFFFLTGVLFFFYSLEKPKFLILSSIFFAIAIPAYHAQRIVTPLMLIALFLRHKKTLLSKTHFRYLIIGAILGFIISLPTLSIATTPGFLARASGLNIFSSNHQPAGFLANYKGIFYPFVNSHIFLSIQEFASLYISYFSPRNMFVLGDSGPRSSFPEIGTFFVWQFPFYIYGMFLFVKNKKLNDLRFFTLSFLLIAPIPAALTRDPYSTIRSLQMVIPLTIVISLAIVEILNKLKKTDQKIIFGVGISILIIYSLLRLYSSAIILNEYYRGVYWNYGWKEASLIIRGLNKNLPIVVDNSRDEPYIQLAFFLKYDPEKYQKENFEVPLSEYYTNMSRIKEKKIGNIVTRPIVWEKDLKTDEYLIGDALAISDQQMKEHNLKLIADIKYPDGIIAIRIVRTR